MFVRLVSRLNPALAVCWSSCSRVIGVPGTGSFIEPDVSTTVRMFDWRCNAVHCVTIWFSPSTVGCALGVPMDSLNPRSVASNGASRTVRSGARNPSALNALQFHAWPGNVRELRNVIERAVIICSGDQIERHHFAPYPIEQRERLRNEDTISLPVGTPLEEVERQMIMRTLHKTKNNKTRAAELLGISLKTLHNKLNLYRERGLINDE